MNLPLDKNNIRRERTGVGVTLRTARYRVMWDHTLKLPNYRKSHETASPAEIVDVGLENVFCGEGRRVACTGFERWKPDRTVSSTHPIHHAFLPLSQLLFSISLHLLDNFCIRQGRQGGCTYLLSPQYTTVYYRVLCCYKETNLSF